MDSQYLKEKELHREISRRVLPQFSNGFFEEAIVNAFKVLEERLRAATGAQEVGEELVRAAFNPNGGVLTDPSSWPAEREGLYLLFRGAFLTYRNPAGHRFIRLDEEQAFDLIVLVNRLLLIVDVAEQRLRSQGVTRPMLLPVRIEGQLWGSAPAMLDTDNDGQNEVVLPILGEPAGVIPGEFMTNSDRPIAIYDVTPNGLIEAVVEGIDAGFGWTLSDLELADVDGDGLHEVVCSLPTFGTIGGFLLLYKYRNGRYEVLKGTLQGTHGFDKQPRPYNIFNNGFLNDFDGDGVQEVVSMPKRGFSPPGLIPPSQGWSGLEQLRLVWKWDPTLGQFRLAQWDIELEHPKNGDDLRWRRIGP